MFLTKDNVGGVVRDTRKSLGLTQAQLAERSGCSQRLVSDFENGKDVGFSNAIAVFSALNLGLMPTGIRIDSRAEVQRVVQSVEADLKSSKGALPKLSDYL